MGKNNIIYLHLIENVNALVSHCTHKFIIMNKILITTYYVIHTSHSAWQWWLIQLTVGHKLGPPFCQSSPPREYRVHADNTILANDNNLQTGHNDMIKASEEASFHVWNKPPIIFFAIALHRLNTKITYRNLSNSFSSCFNIIGIDEHEYVAWGYPSGVL